MTGDANAAEFSRPVDLRSIGNAPIELRADAGERAALAERFGLESVDRLEATVTLDPDGEEIAATGTLTADIVQSCAVSGEDLPVAIREPLDLRFVPAASIAAASPDEEVELEEDELDQIPYEGTGFDLGEAIAQSLALAIDPFATGPAADEARRRHGVVEEGEQGGPLADALRGLKGD